MKIKILNNPGQTQPFLIINKPSGLPSAPLHSLTEDSALSQAVSLYPEIKNITGKKEIEYGLIHRLDTVTEGLLLIALTQQFYDSITQLQQQDKFVKTYTAYCDLDLSSKEGFPISPINKTMKDGEKIHLESYFRAFGKGKKEVRPVTGNSNSYAEKKANLSKMYVTDIFIKSIEKDFIKTECKITQGFRHQVRNHLAWIGLPVKGDPLYNSKKYDFNIEFYATGLDFEYEGKCYSFRLEK